MTRQMTLGDMIDELAEFGPDADVRFAFGRFAVDGLHSYRGYYEELALGYAVAEYGQAPMKASALRATLESAVGRVFEGYKGGEYVMSRNTPMWAANEGDSYQACIVGISNDATDAVIEVASRAKVGR